MNQIDLVRKHQQPVCEANYHSLRLHLVFNYEQDPPVVYDSPRQDNTVYVCTECHM